MNFEENVRATAGMLYWDLAESVGVGDLVTLDSAKEQAKTMLRELDLSDTLAVKVLACMESEQYVHRNGREYKILPANP